MLQILPDGETDNSYDKTINLRELKKFLNFVSNHYTFPMPTERRIADMSVKRFEFIAAVREFHIYGDIWLTYINETLKCLHELLQSSA